jgi:sec-independent protein translocase protein TatB
MDSFFGIGFSELILILIVAGIVMGPERIGQTARWLGRTTAQLQKISRGFVRQLNHELDSSGDGEAIRETMQELQQLRKELTDLRGEFTSTTKQATEAGQQAIDDINNSIKPPSLKLPKMPDLLGKDANDSVSPDDGLADESIKGGVSESSVKNNGASEPENAPRLPNLLDISDDPE